MKPFTDKFISKWKEEFLKPLQRELDVDFDSFASLLQGKQLLQSPKTAGTAKDDQAPGLLLLLDTRTRACQLKTNLVHSGRNGVDAGKRIRGRENSRRRIPYSDHVQQTMSPGRSKKFFPTARGSSRTRG